MRRRRSWARPRGAHRGPPGWALWALLLVATGAAAGELADNALAAFKAGQFELAAQWYDDLVRSDPPAAERTEAEYGVAESLAQLGMRASATHYHQRIVAQGERHPYFDKAVERLATLGAAIDDRALVPAALFDAFGDRPKALLRLPPPVQQGVHYHLGVRALLRDELPAATAHLKKVAPDHPRYAAAQHHLARLMVHPARKGGPDLDGAHAHVDAAEEAVKQDARRLRRPERIALGLLATFVRARRSELLERPQDKRQELGPDLGFRRDLRERTDELRAHLLSRGVAEVVIGERYEALQDLHQLRQITPDPEVQLLYALVLLEMCELDKASAALTKAKALLEETVATLDDDLATVRRRPRDGGPLPAEVVKALKRLQTTAGVATRSGVSAFFKATQRDLSRLEEGALARSALAAELNPKLVAQRDALRAARIDELLAQGDVAARRLREGLARVITATKLIERERRSTNCPSRPPDASAIAYGLALVLDRAQ